LFPTIVTKAESTKVLETGSQGNRDGALLLVQQYFLEILIYAMLLNHNCFSILK
jgi:hypothetical protein